MANITTLTSMKEIERWQFKNELKALVRRVQGVTTERPIIIRIQVGNSGWVLNTDICRDLP